MKTRLQGVVLAARSKKEPSENIPPMYSRTYPAQKVTWIVWFEVDEKMNFGRWEALDVSYFKAFYIGSYSSVDKGGATT